MARTAPFRTSAISKRSSRGLRRTFKGLDRQRDRERYFKAVQANAKATREQILKHLMIRRTRNEIVKYYGEDLKLQGLKFPEVANPQPLFYKFNKTENEVFNETVRLLTKDFTYARYKPLTYYEGERRGTTTAEPAQPRQVHEDFADQTP